MSEAGNLLRAVNSGTTSTVFKGSWGYGAVGLSEDLGRILALPRRVLSAPPPSHWDRFRRDGCEIEGCDFAKGLREIQAAALWEIEQTGGGGFICAHAGLGKTLISLLAGRVIKAGRIVLLIPPSVKSQLVDRDIPHLKLHWDIPEVVVNGGTGGSGDGLYVVTYSELSSPRAGNPLSSIQPDYVIADECHRIARVQSARTKKVRNFFKANPNTKFLGLSATAADRGIRDFAPLLGRALGVGAPIPLRYPVLQEWACAIDGPGYGEQSTEPGHLRQLCNGEELACLERGDLDGGVRSAFRRRMKETLGVVMSESAGVKASLYFHRNPVKVPKVVKKALADLRETWCTPGGEEITTALDFARHARELACGMYLKWEPEPTAAWREARAAWHREVRGAIKAGKPGMESPMLYVNALDRGDMDSLTRQDWLDVADSCSPETVPVWVSDFLLENATTWGQKPGIIWTEHKAVGERLAELSGFPHYFGGEKANRALGNEDGSRSVILSTDAYQEGLNLVQWSRMLYLTPPSNARMFEQTCARVHRSTQRADEVEVHFNLHTPELEKALETAKAKAKVIAPTNGEQKLQYGSWTFGGDNV